MKKKSTVKADPGGRKAAILTAAFLLLTCLTSIGSLLLPASDDAQYAADIFQNGKLIMSIPLNEETEERIFTVKGENGCVNEIEVRPGSIGILSADCPDRLCVRQGFISDTKLPITCLPNRLVIRLRPVSDPAASDSMESIGALDAVTY